MKKLFVFTAGTAALIVALLSGCEKRPVTPEPPPAPPAPDYHGYSIACDNATHTFITLWTQNDGKTYASSDHQMTPQSQVCFNQADGSILLMNKAQYDRMQKAPQPTPQQ